MRSKEPVPIIRYKELHNNCTNCTMETYQRARKTKKQLFMKYEMADMSDKWRINELVNLVNYWAIDGQSRQLNGNGANMATKGQ